MWFKFSQSSIEGGTYWFGSQLASKEGKLIPGNNMEGASPRKKVKVKYVKVYTQSSF